MDARPREFCVDLPQYGNRFLAADRRILDFCDSVRLECSIQTSFNYQRL
jgi:hypothetical protein